MSGHNKWSKIKRKKGKEDKKRGKLFSKLSKAIAVATREGGSGDPDQNISLRFAIDQAKEANMPKDNIKRAIERGLGEGDEGKLEEMILEAYGSDGLALVIRCISDNRNRTVAEIGSLLSRAGGSMAEPGSVLYQFKRRGSIKFEGELKEGEFLELIDCGGVEEMEDKEGRSVVICSLKKMDELLEKLKEMGKSGLKAKLSYIAKNPRQFNEEKGKRARLLVEQVEDREDVQEVFINVV